MVMQFESAREMINVNKKAIFFANDFTRIPDQFQIDYSLTAVALDDWSNLPEIEAEVAHSGYTWGVDVVVLPGEGKRARGCSLMIMKGHD